MHPREGCTRESPDRPAGRPGFDLAEIFRAHSEDFRTRNALSSEQAKVVRAVVRAEPLRSAFGKSLVRRPGVVAPEVPQLALRIAERDVAPAVVRVVQRHDHLCTGLDSACVQRVRIGDDDVGAGADRTTTVGRLL